MKKEETEKRTFENISTYPIHRKKGIALLTSLIPGTEVARVSFVIDQGSQLELARKALIKGVALDEYIRRLCWLDIANN